MECLRTAYNACCKAQDAYDVVLDRQELKQMYIQNPDLVGLEELLLSSVRGSSDGLVRFIMHQASEAPFYETWNEPHLFLDPIQARLSVETSCFVLLAFLDDRVKGLFLCGLPFFA